MFNLLKNGITCIAVLGSFLISSGEISAAQKKPSKIHKAGSVNFKQNQNISNPTPESRRDVLFSTVEGIILYYGWDDAEKNGYDTSVLSVEEKANAVKNGLSKVAKWANESDDISIAGYYSEILARYFRVKKDYKKSTSWAFQGAEQGSSFCMYLLSVAYKGGDSGVVQDVIEGTKWTLLAAAAGDSESIAWVRKHGVNSMFDSSTAAIYKEAQNRANKWMEDHPGIFVS